MIADIADLSLSSESPVFVDPLENLPYTMAFTETSKLREKFGTSGLNPEVSCYFLNFSFP